MDVGMTPLNSCIIFYSINVSLLLHYSNIDEDSGGLSFRPHIQNSSGVKSFVELVVSATESNIPLNRNTTFFMY